MAATNNVIRLLEQKGIPFTAYYLPTEIRSAEETAAQLGVELQRIYKTIVVVSAAQPKKPILAVVPGSSQLDTGLLSALLKEKKLRVALHSEAEKLTGLLTGGISPLALLNRGFRVILDESALALPFIHISGGERGLNLRMKPADLVNLVHASCGCISNRLDPAE